MYLKDGQCENCGFVVFKKQEKQNTTVQEPSNLMCCPDCGHMISKDALSCPQCGCPFPGNMKEANQEVITVQKKKSIGVLGLIVAIVVAGLILWYLMAPYRDISGGFVNNNKISCDCMIFSCQSTHLVFHLKQKPLFGAVFMMGYFCHIPRWKIEVPGAWIAKLNPYPGK
jgi:hypothetical protein